MNNRKSPRSYPTLDRSTSHIRLVRIRPGSTNEKIKCLLYLANLSDKACKYEALSYEWGNTTSNLMHILLNSTDFTIQPNLWWALYYLRDEEVERDVWIDALCIDQNNEAERNHQVRLMSQIYSGAWRVIAWLGKEDQEDFAQAVNFVNLLNGDSEETRYRTQLRPQASWSSPIWVNNTKNVKLSMDQVTLPGETNHHLNWLYWTRMFCRTYWSRLWVIQELILASKLFLRCGKFQLDWELLSYIFSQLYKHHPISKVDANDDSNYSSRFPIPPPIIQNLERPILPAYSDVPYRIYQRRFRIFGDKSTSFTTLFGQFDMYRESKCADVRDRIFGLLGISPKCCQDSIPVDYGMSRIELALAVIDHDERNHQGFRCGLISSQRRANSLIEYLECKDDAQRIVAAIEAFDGPLWPPFGTAEEEQELWRRHNSSIVTAIAGETLVLKLPNKLEDSEGDRKDLGKIENGEESGEVN